MTHQKRENQKFRIINRNNTHHKRNNAAEINICILLLYFLISASSSAFVIITKKMKSIFHTILTFVLQNIKNWQMKYLIFSHLLKRKTCLLVRIKARLLNSLDTIYQELETSHKKITLSEIIF
jgi:hypothetical protein